MDPFILNLGIRWLPAVDAFSASCVSQEWRRFLSADRDNGDFWKQICLNSGLSGVPNLDSSADYRRLAMGLRLRDSKEPPAPQERSYTPTTRPENYEWAPRANVGLLLIGNRDEECGPQIG